MSERRKTKKANTNNSADASVNNTYVKENHLIDFTPKTEGQIEYMKTLEESDVTICFGPAGTGKSMCAIAYASQELLNKRVDSILVARSIVSCDNDIGFLPGGIKEKIDPYMAPYIDYFKNFLGDGRFGHLAGQGVIKFMPVELLRGTTFKKTVMILDEAQNVTRKQIKMFLSRIGEGSKLILIGDPEQSDINNNGFDFCIDNLYGIKGLGIAEMIDEDILRHPIIPEIMRKFNRV